MYLITGSKTRKFCIEVRHVAVKLFLEIA